MAAAVAGGGEDAAAAGARLRERPARGLWLGADRTDIVIGNHDRIRVVNIFSLLFFFHPASLPRLPLLLAFLPFLSIPASNSQARRPPVPAAAAAAVPPLPSRRLPPLRRHPSSRTQGNQRLSRVIAPRGVGRREGDPATLQGIVTAVIWKLYGHCLVHAFIESFA
ncbi:hypothetical protein DAI22_01g442601 [Oryza sativa Japonica Group]|nr:hypothetical protein DAI22_01g442601 [Oryza sativa Japonica Group]